MLRNLTLAFAVAGAILMAPSFIPSQVAHADDDKKVDYYKGLDPYYQNYLRTHRHYYHDGHVHVRTQYYGYATDRLHKRNYTYYSGYGLPYYGYVYAAPVYYHTHGTYIQVAPHAGHIHGHHHPHTHADGNNK